jgi:transglutaminase-like putative cysteine protease
MRLFVLLLLLASFQVHAQPTVSEGKIPAWVTQHEYNGTISDTIETSNGYAYLLISKQAHLESKEQYSEYVTKVTSEKGLSIVSVINEYFDPSFQTLTFHKLNIIRNGKRINKLNPAKFDVIRREDEMERAVYDKSVNAVYNLPDVRVGDIVEYSFTRTGFNPVFNNHRFGTFYFQYGIPVAKFAYKIVYDSHRKIQFKSFGNIRIAAIETQGRLKSTEWIRENVPALLTDDQYPSWFDPYPHIQYSDFQSWNELKQWASGLYSFPKLKNSELKETIASIRASEKTDEAKIKECIRIAQGEIRYLSFSDGINGYKPHSPEIVYSQRYGDCKDKSFMLALMLNELGIDSRPALVSTENGYTLEEMLPNPWAFNHCIVQFTYNDSTYWVDPTLNAQVGPLKSYFFPSYHNALVINNDQSSLSVIPFGYKNASLDIKEEYSMDEVGGYVTLKVNTTFHLDEADEIRSYFKSNTTDQINKDYLNFYAKDYSEISVAKDFKYADDEETNIITSSEEYLIKDFWTINGDNKSADVYASFLATCLKKPETRVRTMPLAITHPRNISQTIKIRLPEKWDIADSDIEIESDAFTYKRSKFYSDKIITLRYHYSTKASFIAAENVADHIEKIDQVLEDNGLTIFKPLSTKTDRSTNAYVIVFILLAVGVYVVKKKFSR